MAIPVTPEEVDMEAGAAHPGAGIHLHPAGDLLEEIPHPMEEVHHPTEEEVPPKAKAGLHVKRKFHRPPAYRAAFISNKT